MFKFTRFSVLFFVLLSVPSFGVKAGYLDGVLLRAEGDIKVYLINNNTKRWVSSIEVFNLENFKWQNVKVVSKKEITAIKEGSPIVLETALPVPVSTSSPQASPETIPTVSISPTPPVPAKINDKLVAPEYISANWLISHTTLNYGRIGQRIVFKYSDKVAYKIENFRLYEKKPGDAYFTRIATFEEIPSTGCEDIDIDGEWMMTEAGQCGYWSIQKIVPPGERNAVAYLSTRNYLIGEYGYYVAGADKDGLETRPSPEAKLVFLNPVDILSPVDGQQTAGIYPDFKWSIAGGWPASPDYFISISDSETAQNPLWAKQIKVLEDKSDGSLNYDGLGLDSTKKYKTYIYGHYRKSEYDPDYISIPSAIPEFQVKSSSPWTYFIGSLKALFLSRF